MKRPLNGTNWFFVDESGDPTFYDRKGNLIVGQEGCSPILLLGFIETSDPRHLRKALLALQQEIKDVRDKDSGHQGSHHRTARGGVTLRCLLQSGG